MKYYVTGTLDESVQTILEGGGAKKTAYLSGINTHCIVGSDPDYNEVREAPPKKLCSQRLHPTPSPLHSPWHSEALYFWIDLSTVLMVQCPKTSWQALTPSLTKANAHLNFKFHCIEGNFKNYLKVWKNFEKI